MSISGLLVFAGAYTVVLILPGPGVTALLARVLARGPDGAPAFIAGFVAGALTWLTIAAAGLAALASAFAVLFLVVRYLGAAYLLYLAWRLWHAPVDAAAAEDRSPDRAWRLFLAGMAINLGNPKVIVFFLALLPTVVNLADLTWVGFAELVSIVTVVASSVLGGYAVAAVRVRRLFRSRLALRAMNRGSGAVMAAAAVATVVK
jgi:threonine/homoserine/homoserine lactone efflux protein